MTTVNEPIAAKQLKDLEQTEHPYIVKVPGIGNGEPIIKDSRVSVRLIAEYYKAGMTVEEVLRDYSYLSAAAIYDAISYYIDHQDEIEAWIEANQIENVLNQNNLALAEDGSVYRVNEPQAD